MRIEQIRDIPGPNVYSHQPVLVMTLDLQDLTGKESYELPGFNDKLISLLPGLHHHYCGLGRPGGFIERLRAGTWFGHIVEHVALELTDFVGISVNRGKTVSAGPPGKFLVAVAYKSAPGMKVLLHTAVELVQAIVDGRDYPLEERLAEAREAVEYDKLGPSTQAVVDAAERQGIPWKRINDASLIQLGYGIHTRRIEATIASTTSVIGVDIAANKHSAKRLLDEAGLPCPRGVVVETEQEALAALENLGAPLVVKPLDGNQGRGVSLNLRTPEQVIEAFRVAQEHSKLVVVEQLFTGRDYRVLIVNGRMIAASEKIAAHVTGDGVSTIRQLVDRANADPRRGDHHAKPLSLLKCDAVVDAYLRKAGKSFDDIPAEGERVFLRESANLSTGGEAWDVTDEVHPQIARMCERAARVVGLDICGLDFVCPDIGQPLPANAGIIEANAAPGIRMHHFPSKGKARDVGAAIVDMLYPNRSNGRIPVITVTGTNGKTTTTRMISHVFSRDGRNVGMTTTDGIWIGGHEVAHGDMTGPWSAGVVLGDPSVEVAVLETARGGIVRGGLGYDWSDVAVVTNIQPDHIGQDGIETVEDIARIKALVPERVRDGGTIVLNADDEHVLALRNRPRIAEPERNTVLFSLNPMNIEVGRHAAEGGTAYVLRGDWIEEVRRGTERRMFRASNVPATFGGTAEFQIANVLACVAACRAAGLDSADIGAALESFDSNGQNNGRVNVYECAGRFVVVDYGHNAHAIDAICRMVTRWRPTRKCAVLGLPGDRTDELIREAAIAAARWFDRLVVREDKNLRGRRKGETPELICNAIRRDAPHVRIDVIDDEATAVRHAIDSAEPGEVIVSFCEHTDDIAVLLGGHCGSPIADPSLLREGLQEALRIPA